MLVLGFDLVFMGFACGLFGLGVSGLLCFLGFFCVCCLGAGGFGVSCRGCWYVIVLCYVGYGVQACCFLVSGFRVV